MEVKFNLDDLPQLNIKLEVGSQISPIVYNAMVGNLSQKSNNEFMITLLSALKDDSLSFSMILKHEVNQLENADYELMKDKSLLLEKIYSFFSEKATLDNIIVFSSLKSGLTETKANIHFREEIINFSSLFEKLVFDFIEKFKELKEDDKIFEDINKNICYLKNLSDRISNYSVKNLKKISNEFITGISFEEQLKIISFFTNGNSNKQILLSNKNTHNKNTFEDNEEEIYDAEVIANKSNEEDVKKHDFDMSIFEELRSTLQENTKSISSLNLLVNSISERNKENENNLADSILKKLEILEKDLLKEKEPNPNFENRFNELIEIQKNTNKELLENSLLVAKEIRNETTTTDNKIDKLLIKIEAFEEKINKINGNSEKTLELFENFIARQTKMTKMIQEKYNINID